LLERRALETVAGSGIAWCVEVFLHRIFAGLLDTGLVAGNCLTRIGCYICLKNIETAALSVSNEHGFHIPHVTLAVSQINYPMNTIKINVGASNG
jgi:hypothetical protein